MGSNSADINTGREQHYDRGLSFLLNPFHSDGSGNKKSHQKMESKVLIWGANILFTSGYGYVILMNIENIKSVVLFFVMIIWGLVRILYYVIKQDQERQMRDLDIQERRKKLNQ